MVYRDLKQFLAKLKEVGELQEMDVEVDPSWEVTPVLREVLDKEGPALLFNKVGKWRTPLAVGVFGSLRRYAIALDMPLSIPLIFERWKKALSNPIKPILVDGRSAPCKEIKLFGDQIDLYADPFPVPLWHELDSNPYLGTLHGVITKDPETGWVNIGAYRNEIKGKNILGQMAVPYRHIGLHLEKWRALGKPMPIAIGLSLDPYLTMVSVTAIPAQVNEYDVAGGLKGEPIEVTRAETSDLPVPAHAQIV
ncbi:MAG: UbiD family decarboxylase, partial [Dehalococcoidia bacterium]|nr:UbiD family decarboxylase [Dehalococcoidia bacterium]